MANSNTQHEGMSEGVPIFLKKTYHMIESCDPEIAGWDEDGLTFTVKDPSRFETTIIPQFFKHSKFTSFVRQLNFYSFRKIKYSDSIRIDLESEKKTANYWRFRHENFRQNRPDLLTEIKRMNGKASSTSTTAPTLSSSASPTATAVQPAIITSSSVAKTIQVAEKSEVLKLKKRIEEMTKNMDKLTEMVEKVSLQQQDQQDDTTTSSTVPGTKRKKVNNPHNMRDYSVESQAMDIQFSMVPDLPLSAMDVEELAALPLLPPSVLSTESIPSLPPSVLPSRETSDNEFVDQLFTAFHEDDDAADWPESLSYHDDGSVSSSNRPDPELMKRLSDALQLLPREIQEMIVNRLIAAITSTDGVLDVVPTATAVPVPTHVEPKKLAAASKALPVAVDEPPQLQQQPPLPLAAATLAALLHHYSNQVKEGSSSSKTAKKNLKSLPVIPVHA